MSDLQIGLILIGLALVLGIVLFNGWQQRRHRRQTESFFQSSLDDVLLDETKPAGRVEPQFVEEQYELEEPVLHEPVAHEPEHPPRRDFVDAEIDYVAEIRTKNNIGAEELAEIYRRKFDFGKSLSVYGLNLESGCWEEPHAKPRYKIFKLGLQLVDRSGAVSLLKLSEFRDMVSQQALRLGAAETCPELEEAQQRAQQLDKFCAEVDMLIGLNVMSRAGEVFAGTRIHELAEMMGFRLEADGTFKYIDQDGAHLFSLCNHEPAVFLPDGIRHLSTHGITFLLDVPRVANGHEAFDRMVLVARRFATELKGVLVDDKRLLLNDAGLDKIRKLLDDIRVKMESRQIIPGSERALRLFS